MKKLALFLVFMSSFAIFAQNNPISTGNIFTEDQFEIDIRSENKDFERVTKSYLILDLKEEKVEKNGVQIYDASGEYIMSKSPKSHISTIDISHLASGTYFLHVKSDNGLVVKQVTIQRKGRSNEIIIK